MAGNGRTPALPEDRVSRNKLQAGEWVVLPSAEYSGDMPPCPMAVTARAVEMWEDWWASPMAWMWDKTDWPGLEVLLLQEDALFIDPSNTSLSSEVRQKENIFGLSPQGRQQRRWRLPEDSDAVDADKARTITAPDRAKSRGAMLKAVK